MTLTRFAWLAWRRNPEFAVLVKREPQSVKTLIEMAKFRYLCWTISLVCILLSAACCFMFATQNQHDDSPLIPAFFLGLVAIGGIGASRMRDLRNEEKNAAAMILLENLNLVESVIERPIGKKIYDESKFTQEVKNGMGHRAYEIYRIQGEEAQFSWIGVASKELRAQWAKHLETLGSMFPRLTTKAKDYFPIGSE